MEKSKELELFRKIPHMITGIIYLAAFLYLGYSKVFVWGSCIVVCASILGIFLVRYVPWWHQVFRSMIREGNPIKGIGVPMYFGGMFIACSFHYFLGIPKDVVVYAIITLAIGDGIATIVGKSHLGVCRPFGYAKSYSGMIVGIILSLIVSGCFLIMFEMELNTFRILMYVTIGMIIEFLLVHKKAHKYCLDNFVIPFGIVLLSIACE